MASKRIHEIAKELEVSNKEVLRACEHLGIEAKSHSSSVAEEAEKEIRDFFKQKGAKKTLPTDFLGDEKIRARVVVLRKVKSPGVETEEEAAAAAEAEPSAVSEPEAETPPGEEPEPVTEPTTEPEEEVKAEETEKKPTKKPKGAKRPRTTARILGQIDLPEPADAGEQTTQVTRRKKKKRREEPEELETPRRRKRHLPRATRLEERKRPAKRPSTLPPKEKKAVRKKVTISTSELLAEFAVRVGEPYETFEEKLLELGYESPTRATLIRREYLELLADAMGFEPVSGPAAADVKPRPPVVAVLGHVDHGKTTLLDVIRRTNVVASESGGITQHIGASNVDTPGGPITFLDTPGHELFTSLRARGASITDIVVLVVAADDGVMPQTTEAINHAKAANVPIIVAITKTDLPGAEPSRVRQQLTAQGVTPEDLGGDVLVVETAAPKGKGVAELLETILLQAEVLELKADYAARASGVVVESKVDKARGPVITLLVREGTVRVGDPFIAGTAAGKIRAMTDDKGNKIEAAYPSQAVGILGCEGVPEGGDPFTVVPDYKLVRQIASDLSAAGKVVFEEEAFTLDEWYNRLKQGVRNELNLILKADVAGSVEALKEAVEKLGNEEVGTKVLHGAPGGVTENDVLLASASKAVIVGFHVGADSKSKKLAEREGVEIRLYDVIYEAIDDIKAALEGLLKPAIVEETTGEIEVRQVFAGTSGVRIAGSSVKTGRIYRGARVRVFRNEEELFDGKVASLRRFADDVKEVGQGMECGLTVGGFNDFKPGDIITVIEEKKVARKLVPA